MVKNFLILLVFLIVLPSNLEGIRILHLTDLHIDYFKLFSRNYLKNIEVIRSSILLLKPDIIVLTGDIVEFGEGIFACENYHILTNIFYCSNGVFYFDRDYRIPLYMVAGNHEYETLFKTTTTEIPNYARFVGKEFLNYYVDIKNTRLIFLNTGYDYYLSFFAYNNILPEPEASGLTTSQIGFLKSALETSTNKFNIILTHHPFLNKDNEGVFLFNRKEFNDLISSNNVHLILSGHTHKNRVFNQKTNLVNKFPITNISNIYHVQTGSIGKDGYFRMIEVFEWGVVIHRHSNVTQLLNLNGFQ